MEISCRHSCTLRELRLTQTSFYSISIQIKSHLVAKVMAVNQRQTRHSLLQSRKGKRAIKMDMKRGTFRYFIGKLKCCLLLVTSINCNVITWVYMAYLTFDKTCTITQWSNLKKISTIDALVGAISTIGQLWHIHTQWCQDFLKTQV